MPGGDGTGPGGMGPMTGRAAGYCAGYATPGFANPVGGFGGGAWGRGGGRGRRNWYNATGVPGWQRAAAGQPAFGGGWAAPAPYAQPYAQPYAAPYAAPAAPVANRDQQLEALKGQAEYFEDALEGIKKRIEELQAKSEE